jgi:hypothetical protein
MTKRVSPDNVVDLTLDDDHPEEERRNNAPVGPRKRLKASKSSKKKKNSNSRGNHSFKKKDLDDGGGKIGSVAALQKSSCAMSLEDDEDEDCCIMEAPPKKIIAAQKASSPNDNDEIEVVGTANETKLPHMRQVRLRRITIDFLRPTVFSHPSSVDRLRSTVLNFLTSKGLIHPMTRAVTSATAMSVTSPSRNVPHGREITLAPQTRAPWPPCGRHDGLVCLPPLQHREQRVLPAATYPTLLVLLPLHHLQQFKSCRIWAIQSCSVFRVLPTGQQRQLRQRPQLEQQTQQAPVDLWLQPPNSIFANFYKPTPIPSETPVAALAQQGETILIASLGPVLSQPLTK